MPLYPFFTGVAITPLIGHPNFPQFARGASFHEKPDSKPKPDSILHLVDVRIEYARAGDKLPDLVQAEWRASENMLAKGQLRSEEHTSELQSLMRISYAVFCLKKKKT